ncbi:ribonuclease domain-containing protein [Nocardioides limicola]|uniref:ribonuclease domain-containing protein n=1 Tax=Nocardioides limicola TaxID=2803368 RepID=UPI0027DE1AE5|nr:ribonuclease domain-containing protein [Nocardioides sp. DJM-14]
MSTVSRRTRGLVTAVAVLVLLLAWWLLPEGDEPAPVTGADPQQVEPAQPPAGDAEPPGEDDEAAPPEAVDPHSGLPWVDVADLPAEAHDVLARIDAGGPFRYDKDGSTFGNFERLLPAQRHGWYREYTVDTPGLSHRGAKRIVTGGTAEFYWTEDHYESFERIDR